MTVICPSSHTHTTHLPHPNPFFLPFFPSPPLRLGTEAWKGGFVVSFSSSNFFKPSYPCGFWMQKLFLINSIGVEASWQKQTKHHFSCKVIAVLTQQTSSACSAPGLRFCDKAYLHTHRGAQRDNGSGGSLPQLLPSPSQVPLDHQKPISTSPEGHRGQRQAGTQIKDSEQGPFHKKVSPWPGPSLGCPGRASAPLPRGQQEHVSRAPFGLGWGEGITA